MGRHSPGCEWAVASRSRVSTLAPLVLVRIAATLALMAILVSPALAQSDVKEVRVVATVAPPFVMQETGNLTGFSVELWDAVAARLKLKTTYQLVPDIVAFEEAMRTKKADIGIIPVFITSARDEVFDFSYPILETGLQIMVRGSGEGAAAGFSAPLVDMLSLLFSRTTIVWLGVALVLVLIPAHLIWLLERRRAGGIISSQKYFPGIFEAIYWALSTLTTQAESMPHQWIARVLAIFWMFAGVVFVAFYTAQLTTTLTVQQIRGAIEDPSDLPGKRVGTIFHSTSADFLREHNAQVVEFPEPGPMFKALRDKKVEAVVFTAPVLRYYEVHEGRGLVKVVGPEFDTAPIAFIFQLDSPLRRQVNSGLLKLREDGTYHQLLQKWFGTE